MNRTSPPLVARLITGRAHPWWVIGLLVALVSALAWNASVARVRGRSAASEPIRLALDSLRLSKEAYIAHIETPGSDRERLLIRTALDRLESFASVRKDRAPLRRLMIMQSALGVGSWRMTLDRLKAASPPRSPFEEDREAAYWGTLLGDGNTSQSDLNTALQWAEQEKLGWYLWVLRAHALRSAHLETAADEAQKTALQGGMRTRSLSLAVSLMQVCGVGILLLSAVHYIRRRRDPDALIPSVLQARPLPPLTTLQGDAMFAVFVVHLLARIFASLGALALAKAGMARHGETLAQILPIAAPAAAWIILSRRAGLRMETMGLKRLKSHADSRDSRMRNVVVAVMAYIALVPVLMLAVQVSTTLFGGMETPLNPTVVAYIEHTDFASRMRLLLHAVLQAPVIEEALFRGVFYRCLDVKLGSIAALIVSSAVFALLHPQLPLGFLGLFVLGGGFAVVYRLTGSVWPCVLTHALNNLVVTIQLAAGADV